MVCGVLLSSISVICPCKTSIYGSKRSTKIQTRSRATRRIQCSNSGPDLPLTTENFQNDASMTGGAYDFERATTSLTSLSISSSKKVTLVRHGLSSWNEESRVQNLEAVDAKERYPKEYTTWREDPANFCVNGVYPVRKLWGTAREAWREILLSPGESFLVVTHKSILRSLICTALGLPPERFRAIDVNNGGISVFNFNKRGEAMLQSLNMTAHMYNDHVYLY
ncbi:hypothetical protein I3760_09G059200 [Carya illinoinensis]|nr:hypothetical protein I3760_09G059200 [Carya illinoinensis]